MWAPDGDPWRFENDSNGSDQEADFDTNIPGIHKYLGRLDIISGHTLYDAGQIVELNAMFTNTLAFPGYTLPLVIIDQNHDFEVGYKFVLICLSAVHNDFFNYGVIMEVFEMCADGGTIRLKARGRQRCFVPLANVQLRPMANRYQMIKVKVQVLPDTVYGNPLSCSQLAALKQKFRYYGERIEHYHKHFDKCRQMHLSQFPWPNFVYDHYDVDYHVERIIRILSRHYDIANIPRDPTMLSYWFGQNFQLKHEERLEILSSNTAVERLQAEYRMLTSASRIICCEFCGCELAEQNQVFAMSKEGAQGNFVNPGGVVYEIVTVKKCINIIINGEPSTQFSWFPGYAWTVLKCRLCTTHLGWLFTSRKLQPKLFYGLARSSLCIKTGSAGAASGGVVPVGSERTDDGWTDDRSSLTTTNTTTTTTTA